MSLNGQLELSVNEEKRFGFLNLCVKDGPGGDYLLTARIAEDADKTKYKNWKCDAMIGKLCGYCGRGCGLKEQRQVSLTNDAPLSFFSLVPIPALYVETHRFVCRHHDFKVLLFVFVHAESVSKCDPESKLEETKSRFTDEAEAEKLNANLKIHFNDSNELVFANRELLGVYSNIFRAMFEGDAKENEIKLNVNREDFLAFLNCVYFPTMPVTAQNFKAVAMIADRFDCPQLLRTCKDFVEEAVKTITSIEECKDFVEVSERLEGSLILTSALNSLKTGSADFIRELFDCEWMMARKKSTRQAIFAQIKKRLPLALWRPATLVSEVMVEGKKTRFTDEAKAKELNANCKIRFGDSTEPIFINRHFLTMYSKVFRVMFEGDFKEKDADEVTLDLNREDFLDFLDCLYFPAMPVAAHNFKTVAILADRYDCPELLEKCKEFAEIGAKNVATIKQVKDYIEVAERLDWQSVIEEVNKSMKSKGATFFMELLESDWIEERKKTTQQALFNGMKEVVLSHLK